MSNKKGKRKRKKPGLFNKKGEKKMLTIQVYPDEATDLIGFLNHMYGNKPWKLNIPQNNEENNDYVFETTSIRVFRAANSFLQRIEHQLF